MLELSLIALSFQLAPVHAADFGAAIAELTTILNAHTAPLDRRLITFHYETDTAEPTSLEGVRTHTSGWPEHFFDPDLKTGSMQGPGTYVAIDPASSRSYGNDRPRLYVLTLKPGTRVFNAEAPTSTAEVQVLTRLLTEFDCRQKKQSSAEVDLSDFVAFFRGSDALECRNLIIAAVRRANVEASLFSFAAANRMGECRPRDEALAIYSTNAYDMDRIAYFSPTTSFESRPLRSYLSRLYPEAMRDFESRNQPESAAWERFSFDTENLAPYPLYRQWKRINLFRCGPKWAAEDAEALNFNLLVRQSAFNAEVQGLLIAARRAFEAREKTSGHEQKFYFDARHIAEVERHEYLLAGYPGDFSRLEGYINAKATYEKLDGPDAITKTEPLLEEAGRYQTTVENVALLEPYVKSLSLSQRLNPNLAFELMARSGMGTRLALISANGAIASVGGAPYLTATPRHGLNALTARAYRQNVKVFSKLLQRCIATYQDPQATFDQIQAGSCGVRQDR